MRKKGFTLIELLAVIIILAILMIIAVPNILSTLATARQESFLSQAKSIYKSAQQQFILDSMTGSGNSCYDASNLDMGSASSTLSFVVQMDEEDGSINNITVMDSGQQLKAFGTDINGISLETYTEGSVSCSGYSVPYKEKLLHGTDPVIAGDLIPVKLSSTGSSWTVTYADITKRWYKYGSSQWANAVRLIDTPSQTYTAGDTIKHEDINAYFVWIPKYKYKLFNMGNYNSTTNETLTPANRLIEIEFGTDNTTDTDTSCVAPMTSGGSGNCAVGKYMTHPAFISFNSNGFWVGKFEATGSISAITVLPGSISIRSQTVSAMFTNAYNYNRTLDSHMMKNTEWGAVAYLTNSSYGRGNNELWINNNSNFITGCVGASASSESVDGCTNLWYSTNGNNGSTTKNISGIYDMSGGSWEYVAAFVMEYLAEEDKLNVLSYSSKYYDLYTVLDDSLYSYNYRILGDATGELGPFGVKINGNSGTENIGSWYDDRNTFLNQNKCWFGRGGNNTANLFAGIFNFDPAPGGSHNRRSFRVVLAP